MELLSVSEFKQKKEPNTQLLSELKAYAINKDVHPLVTLILLSDVEYSVLKEDHKNNPGFYEELQERLNSYYNNTGYAQQFKELINSLTRAERDQKLDYYQRATYILGVVSFILVIGIILLLIKLKRSKKAAIPQENINLTAQEERIAELIVLDKTNKEIATELFISVSTVKTHIRNIYAKLEVSNRKEFVEKIKIQSGD
ncbi:helix-turn-helix transcriptional regulator [Robertkochia sp. 1368]|nr:helix-turn-helix transcriptional regulator [Robertkochia sediminum]MBL7472060.1 helix-turn-helix transcriptional regulator [Robertkochia sediminum]